MKDKYLKAYKTAIKEARDTIQSLKGEKDVNSIRTMRQKQDLIDTLSNRVKRLEADIINQTDKLKSLGALNKPSGAFYKNQLKSLKKDQALFKHDLFEHKIVKNPVEAKADSAFKKAREDFKQGEKVGKDPTKKILNRPPRRQAIPKKISATISRMVKGKLRAFKKKLKRVL